jgi:hypothetical protein
MIIYHCNIGYNCILGPECQTEIQKVEHLKETGSKKVIKFNKDWAEGSRCSRSTGSRGLEPVLLEQLLRAIMF